MLEKLNRFIEKWMAFVTPVCLLVGVLFPEMAGRGLPYVTVVFAAMTFIGGLKSSFRDVLEVFRKPFPLLLALLILHAVMPVLAFLMGSVLFPDNKNLVTGMVLEFVVPCAVVSLMWVSIYQGSNPLSLALMVVDTLLAPFTVPFTLHVLLGSEISIDKAGMMKDLLVMIAIPAVAAMCLNHFSHGKTKEVLPSKLALFSKICLIFVVTSNSSKAAPYIREMNGQRMLVAVCILVLAAGGYAIGWAVSRLTRQDFETKVSLIYGAGMRNISAGAVIAASYFPAEVLFPVMIGTLFQQVLAAFYGQLLVRNRERSRDPKGGIFTGAAGKYSGEERKC